MHKHVHKQNMWGQNVKLNKVSDLFVKFDVKPKKFITRINLLGEWQGQAVIFMFLPYVFHYIYDSTLIFTLPILPFVAFSRCH